MRLGLAGNWNRCVALASAPLVAVFHQDDVMLPGHLAAHVRAFDAEPGAALVWSGAGLIDAEGRSPAGSAIDRGGAGPADRVFAPGELLRTLAVGNPVRCSAVTIRKSAHAAAGGFDSSYRYVLDWDFWIRLARTWKVVWLARPTTAVRWHPASETHRFKTGTTDLDEQVRLLDDLFLRESTHGPDWRSLRRLADQRLARAFLNRAHDALAAASRRWPGVACDGRWGSRRAYWAPSPVTRGWRCR